MDIGLWHQRAWVNILSRAAIARSFGVSVVALRGLV